MDIMKEADFRKAIKSDPDKAYLFFGDEDYMKNFAVNTAIARRPLRYTASSRKWAK